MIVCKVCGKENQDKWNVCIKCGTPLEKTEVLMDEDEEENDNDEVSSEPEDEEDSDSLEEEEEESDEIDEPNENADKPPTGNQDTDTLTKNEQVLYSIYEVVCLGILIICPFLQFIEYYAGEYRFSYTLITLFGQVSDFQDAHNISFGFREMILIPVFIFGIAIAFLILKSLLANKPDRATTVYFRTNAMQACLFTFFEIVSLYWIHFMIKKDSAGIYEKTDRFSLTVSLVFLIFGIIVFGMFIHMSVISKQQIMNFEHMELMKNFFSEVGVFVVAITMLSLFYIYVADRDESIRLDETFVRECQFDVMPSSEKKGYYTVLADQVRVAFLEAIDYLDDDEYDTKVKDDLDILEEGCDITSLGALGSLDNHPIFKKAIEMLRVNNMDEYMDSIVGGRKATGEITVIAYPRTYWGDRVTWKVGVEIKKQRVSMDMPGQNE
ncbi:MAG: zinc ribbon domain-containing protein [Lachnospiraceae bacterium]|nr:zinc ribbon domain-containing protein [Lachnospiraceae bacterium]